MKIPAFFSHPQVRRYAAGLLLVLAATALSALFHQFISPTNLVMIYLLAVVLAATFQGRGAAILVSVLGVVAFDFFFVPPYYTMAVDDTEYLITFAGLLGVGLVISELTARVRAQAEKAQRGAEEIAVLYALSQDLAVAEGLDAIIQVITTNIQRAFGRQAVIQIPASRMASGPRFPLKTSQGLIGVLEILPLQTLEPLSAEQHRLLETFASQAALAIERTQLADRARQARLLEETEKLQTALLNSVSHDLRTPLAVVTGALSSLQDENVTDPTTRQTLIDTAREESDRLNRLVGNLLNMTRIQAGGMRLVKEPADIQDVIGSALEQMGRYLEGRPIQVEIAADLPLVPLDFVLIVQVLVNLLDNALKYAPPRLPIEVKAYRADPYLEVQILDRGPGIPITDLPHMFAMFFRVKQHERIGGTGLGLSICKGILDAHGGRIRAENRAEGGAVFTVSLPLDGADIHQIGEKQ